MKYQIIVIILLQILLLTCSCTLESMITAVDNTVESKPNTGKYDLLLTLTLGLCTQNKELDIKVLSNIHCEAGIAGKQGDKLIISEYEPTVQSQVPIQMEPTGYSIGIKDKEGKLVEQLPYRQFRYLKLIGLVNHVQYGLRCYIENYKPDEYTEPEVLAISVKPHEDQKDKVDIDWGIGREKTVLHNGIFQFPVNKEGETRIVFFADWGGKNHDHFNLNEGYITLRFLKEFIRERDYKVDSICFGGDFEYEIYGSALYGLKKDKGESVTPFDEQTNSRELMLFKDDKATEPTLVIEYIGEFTNEWHRDMSAFTKRIPFLVIFYLI
jgi:hypothetical protein